MLIDSLKTSLIDANMQSNHDLRHDILVNDDEHKIITTIREQLRTCDSFIISVAFITMSGLTLILEELRALNDRKIKGKILTGNYLSFSEPQALIKLSQFPNLEVRMLTSMNLHVKGYFFEHNEQYDMIIGSANLTQNALTENQEWNIKFTGCKKGELVHKVLKQFYKLYDQAQPYDQVHASYQMLYMSAKDQVRPQEQSSITPNVMQREALENLEQLTRSGEKKALLISATGTGKTYLSAFAVQEYQPAKMLFIVHRTNIAQKAMETFQKLMPNIKMGLYSGKRRGDEDYLFATIQTLRNDLSKFSRTKFDYIIIDEVHHAQAKTYREVIDYFQPNFLLGMTATPERSDDLDIYSLFDHNICYEIRLYQALKLNLLTPFHYFAISELIVDQQQLANKQFQYLSSPERIKHIISNINYYGHDKDQVCGLVFVTTVEEAKMLAKSFLTNKIRACALTGNDSEHVREKRIKQLENGDLDYLITVDIFNEGIDIPKVNQIVLLRPTMSSIVYIQQLGRGLRLSANKQYVVVLDFIANYEQNFLIPLALSQNNNYNKDDLRNFVSMGTNLIPGCSSVSFDQVSKELILSNINRTNFSRLSYIKPNYQQLEKQLGRRPMLIDFYDNKMISPTVLLNYKHTYYQLLETMRVQVKPLTEEQLSFLKQLSTQFSPAKRPHEMIILKLLLKNNYLSIVEIAKQLKTHYNLTEQDNNINNALDHLSQKIFTSFSYRNEYSPILEIKNNRVLLSTKFKQCMISDEFMLHVNDLITFNLKYWSDNYWQSNMMMIIGKRYSKQEAFHYLNLDYSNGYQVSGYTCFKEAKICILFIILDDTSVFTDYSNQIIGDNEVTWFSKKQRVLEKAGKLTVEGEIANNQYTLEVFIKRTRSEEFYYLGQVQEVLQAFEIMLAGKKVVKYNLQLANSIAGPLYDFLKENV